ncbi:unnamed protein product [Closterium sp. NIES-54]
MDLGRGPNHRGPVAVAAPAVAALPCTCPCQTTPPTEPRRAAKPHCPAEPRRPTEPRCPTEPHCPTYTAPAATAASTTTAATAAMASPTVLTFDAEGRAVDFDVWVDDLQLFLQCDSRDGVSLFDHTSGVSTAPTATADSTVRSQWTTRDAIAHLAVCSHLPPTERAHFGQYKTAQSLYDAVVARYSSPATVALGRLILPYLFPDLAAFATVADLITHLRSSDAHYRAALPTDQEHILSLRPTELTVDLLEERLAAPEKSILAVELPRWGDMLRQNVAIFDLDFDAILAAIYAVSDSAEGDCYLSVPPDPGIGAAALGASESAAPGTSESAAPSAGESATPGTGKSALSGALHTFTLDSGASRSFFRDSTTLTPLSRPVAVSMADPSGGPVLAHSSTVLPCPAAPSGLLSGLHLPSFSMNLVSGADLQDAWVDQFTPGGQRVTHCTCSRKTATWPRSPVGLGLVLSLPPCSCRPLSHETLLWHHRLGHPSLPRLQGMASRTLVSGLPRSLPPLPPRPAPTRVPCVKGRQRAAPHSSTFPPTEALVQTLHMDVCGPARVSGQGHERYFLLVVDDYSRYTTVFPLRSKGEVTEVLIEWIRSARRQLSERFGSDLPVLRLHSDRGGEFSSDLLRAFYRAEGIRQTFMLPASPQ